MKVNKNKAINFFALGFASLLAVTAVVNYMNEVRRNVYVAALSAFCIPIPFILRYFAKRKHISLPINFKAVALGFMFSTQYLGELVGFYYTLWWWDLLLHGFAGMYAVIVGVFLTKGIFKKEKKATDRKFLILISFFAFCFSVTISTLWEVFEFAGDIILKTNMLQEGLRDTFEDLIAGVGMAILTSVVLLIYPHGACTDYHPDP
jgi:hypothetical protein